MSWDFWAGYCSGAAGIVIGSPLDLLKVQRQAGLAPSWNQLALEDPSRFRKYASLTRGALAPILGYGALNGLLFVAYNRTLIALDPNIKDVTKPSLTSSWKVWMAGAAGGLASWIVSAPTELIKCRKQLGDRRGLLLHTRQILQHDGLAGLYRGGAITSVRDAIGYGFYFWSYEKAKGVVGAQTVESTNGAKIMLCGGIAGVATWASIYPLDVIKTRIQGADFLGNFSPNGHSTASRQVNTSNTARTIFQEGGVRPFFRGLGACSARAFLVNAVQWYIYEGIMGLRPPSRVT